MFTCLWKFYDGFCVPLELGVKGETTKNYKVKRKINKKKVFKLNHWIFSISRGRSKPEDKLEQWKRLYLSRSL